MSTSVEKLAFVGTIVLWTWLRRFASSSRPPVAKRVDKKVYYGINPSKPSEHRGNNPMNPPKERVDPYYWLRDDSRKSPEVLDYLRAENEYCEAQTAHSADLQKRLYKDILSHLKETDADYPYKRGNFLYYTRTVEGLSYKIHCRKPAGSEDGAEQIVIDENEVANGHEYSVVADVEPSPDHRFVAYSVDHNGYETYSLRIKSMESGQDLANEETKDMTGDIVWGADSSTYFYLKMDSEHRPHQLWMHSIGTPQEQDLLVHSESDAKFWMGIDKTSSERFLVIQAGGKETDECHVIDLADIEGPAAHRQAAARKVCVRRREFGVRYDVEHLDDKFYIVTNKDGAKCSKLVCVDVSAVLTVGGQASWTDVKPYDPKIQIDGIVPFKKHIAIFGRENGFEQLWITKVDEDLSQWTRCQWPEDVYSVWQGRNCEFDSSKIRLGYSSLLSPKQVLDLDLETFDLEILKEQPVPGYVKTNYRCKRLEAVARDGTKVPMSMVYHIDFDPGLEPQPTVLYGYGSYGACIDPTFDFKRSTLLDSGICYVIAHIRGGGEMGRTWYEDEGKYLNKMNTFTDFADCAEFLIKQKLTTSSMLAAIGRSAGGLLMGAIANMYPHLFKAIIADVPFVDVMNSMSDPTIPLTITEWEEWGNPNSEKYFEYMDSYSPYDNVVRQKYPAMLVTGGLNDPRVAYWEPAKWVAKIRYLKENSDETPLLFKTDMSAGHFSASDRYKYIKETAFEYSFIIDQIAK